LRGSYLLDVSRPKVVFWCLVVENFLLWLTDALVLRSLVSKNSRFWGRVLGCCYHGGLDFESDDGGRVLVAAIESKVVIPAVKSVSIQATIVSTQAATLVKVVISTVQCGEIQAFADVIESAVQPCKALLNI